MAIADGVLLSGTAASRPAAGNTGCIYYATDTGALSRDNGSTWEAAASTSSHNHDSTYAPIAKGVTNGDTHDHSGGDGAQVAHASLSGIGTNTHDSIDTHLAASAPHSGHAASVHTHAESDVTGLVSDLAAKVATSRQVVSGGGLTGGGDLSADRTLAVGAGTGITVNADDVAVNYGSSSTTACRGDDARLSDARTPTAHATSHKSGGSDAIKLDELAAPTDVTTLDASTSAHGLMKKYPGGTTTFLRADGAFAAPTAEASVTFTTVEQDLGALAQRAGSFDITGLSGLTADKQVSVFQSSAAYTGKGTLKDEIEMNQAHASGYVLSTTSIRVRWACGRFGALKGNVKFSYLVSA